MNDRLRPKVLVLAEAAKEPSTTGSWLDFLKGLVPANIFGLQASTRLADDGATTALGFNVLQILVILYALLGLSVVISGDRVLILSEGMQSGYLRNGRPAHEMRPEDAREIAADLVRAADVIDGKLANLGGRKS